MLSRGVWVDCFEMFGGGVFETPGSQGLSGRNWSKLVEIGRNWLVEIGEIIGRNWSKLVEIG